MSVELKTFSEGNKTFLAVGCIEDFELTRNYGELRYKATCADGAAYYTNDYEEALAFISIGLEPPKNTWTMQQ